MNANLKKKATETIVSSLSKGSSLVKACKGADVDVSTFWRWRQASKELEKKVEAIMDSRIQIVEDALFANAAKGNVTAQIFFLQNRAPDRWQDKRHFEHDGKIEIVFTKAVEKI